MEKRNIEYMRKANTQTMDGDYTLIAGVASTLLRGRRVLGPVCAGQISNTIHEKGRFLGSFQVDR